MRMQSETIYSDDEREFTWRPGQIVVWSRAANKTMTFPASKLILDPQLQRKSVALLKKIGKNPADYRVLWRLGDSDLVTPTDVAEKVFREGTRLEAEYEAECKRIRNLPENRERDEIERLWAEADRIERSDREDNVATPVQLRSRARRLMAEWRKKYPEAGRDEDRRELMAKAADLRSKAVGALTYDADGSLGPEEQKRSHDEFIRQAEELERKAAHLTVDGKRSHAGPGVPG